MRGVGRLLNISKMFKEKSDVCFGGGSNNRQETRLGTQWLFCDHGKARDSDWSEILFCRRCTILLGVPKSWSQSFLCVWKSVCYPEHPDTPSTHLPIWCVRNDMTRRRWRKLLSRVLQSKLDNSHNTPDITNYYHGCSYLLDFRGNGSSKFYLHRNKKRRDPGEKTKPTKLST